MDNISSFGNENTITDQATAQGESKNPLPSYEGRDLVFGPVMLAVGFLFTQLVIWGHMGFDVTVFTLAYLLAVTLWLRPSMRPLSGTWLVYAGLCVVLSLYFAIYDNIILKKLALAILTVIAAYFALSISGARIENRMGRYFPIDIVNALITPFKNLGLAPRILFYSSREKSFNAKNIGMLVLGFILVIPIVIYVVALLSNADALFAGLVGDILYDSDFITFAFKTVSTVLVALYLYALVFGSRLLAKDPKLTAEDADKFLEKFHFLPKLLTIGAAIPLIGVYCLFFFSQRAYFLSGLAGLLPEGWTIAEYARQGFFELCTVSAINLAVISVLMALTKRDSEKSLVLRILCVLFTLLSMALVVMSLSKMLLYIDFYGLTPKRLYTSAFMVFLLLVFGILTAKSFLPKLNISRWIISTMLTLFIGFCILNPGALIARHNVERYYSGELTTLDIELLCSLDDSAVPHMLRALELGDDNTLEHDLRLRYNRYHHSDGFKNLTSRRAYRQLEASGRFKPE